MTRGPLHHMGFAADRNRWYRGGQVFPVRPGIKPQRSKAPIQAEIRECILFWQNRPEHE